MQDAPAWVEAPLQVSLLSQIEPEATPVYFDKAKNSSILLEDQRGYVLLLQENTVISNIWGKQQTFGAFMNVVFELNPWCPIEYQ